MNDSSASEDRTKGTDVTAGERLAAVLDELRAYAYNCAAHMDNRAFSEEQRMEMKVGLRVAKQTIALLTAPAVKSED